LIHLRGEHSALGTGELFPLETSSDAVAAYIRRDGDRAALVIASLGTAALAGVTIFLGGACSHLGVINRRVSTAARLGGHCK
jgi:hypothetical protein